MLLTFYSVIHTRCDQSLTVNVKKKLNTPLQIFQGSSLLHQYRDLSDPLSDRKEDRRGLGEFPIGPLPCIFYLFNAWLKKKIITSLKKSFEKSV